MSGTRDMNPTVAKIVGLYADLGVNGVMEDGAANTFIASNVGDNRFNTVLTHVQDVATQLEEDVEGQLPGDQVRSALGLINSLKREKGKQSIARELAFRRYGQYWTPAQCEYFNEACRKLAWQDFFLSFTSYNPVEGQVQLINNEHRTLILHTLREFRKPSIVESNMFAKVLHYYLVNNLLEGYWDPEHRGPGNVIQTLQNEARTALTFVQVIQNAMFAKWPNFCLVEYKAAAEDESRTVIFVMSGLLKNLVDRNLIDNRMHDWHKAIRAEHTVEIQPAATAARIRAVIKEIETQIVAKVRKVRTDLIESVPV